MKKITSAIMTLLLIASLCACGEMEHQKWDVSLVVPEESLEESYAIAWDNGDSIISKTGCFSIQNRSLFDITVHLVTAGAEELELEVHAGGWLTQYQIEKNVSYRVGIHADKGAGTPLEIVIYDGDNIKSDPYYLQN